MYMQVKEIQENIENAHGPKTKIAKVWLLHFNIVGLFVNFLMICTT